MRAYQYFNKLVSLGDFPIVTEVLPDETEVLKEESKRQPRNKVARFIIEDLDRAIELMSLTTDNGKNRLTKNVALLFKSRVALFEATWLKYHKGTDRVPGGPGWPGKRKRSLLTHIWICSWLWIYRLIAKCCIVKVSARCIVSV